MLTVDYDRLGVQAGDRLLDLGCGAGRHAYEAARRGARVVALDADDVEVKTTAALLEAMADENQIGDGGSGCAAVGDALQLPFANAAFDRVIASEVMEHVPADVAALDELVRVLRPGGTIAITVPRWFPELVCWALSDEYHNRPGGHVRIYRRSALEARMRGAGLAVIAAHHAHGLHSAYWWLKCAVGVDDDSHRLVRAYHRLLVWDIEKRPAVTRVAEAVTSPLMGKSLVVYGRKPPC
ncbi:MAG TPA: methyltransferase domain-containing protein [Acidimicrobiales bacterium]|nr:methyltransferase domain-containing protein [Acidimicrobiales bacterium]